MWPRGTGRGLWWWRAQAPTAEHVAGTLQPHLHCNRCTTCACACACGCVRTVYRSGHSPWWRSRASARAAPAAVVARTGAAPAVAAAAGLRFRRRACCPCTAGGSGGGSSNGRWCTTAIRYLLFIAVVPRPGRKPFGQACMHMMQLSCPQASKLRGAAAAAAVAPATATATWYAWPGPSGPLRDDCGHQQRHTLVRMATICQAFSDTPCMQVTSLARIPTCV